jgi:hypothetical protein
MAKKFDFHSAPVKAIERRPAESTPAVKAEPVKVFHEGDPLQSCAPDLPAQPEPINRPLPSHEN